MKFKLTSFSLCVVMLLAFSSTALASEGLDLAKRTGDIKQVFVDATLVGTPGPTECSAMLTKMQAMQLDYQMAYLHQTLMFYAMIGASGEEQTKAVLKQSVKTLADGFRNSIMDSEYPTFWRVMEENILPRHGYSSRKDFLKAIMNLHDELTAFAAS